MLKILFRDGVWVEGTYKGNWFQAKVYATGSEYGINGGKVSKLCVCSGTKWDKDEILVSYDRGYEGDMGSPAEVFELELANELAAVLEKI